MADFEVNNKETIINLLNCNGKIQNQLFDNAKKIKEKFFKNEIIRNRHRYFKNGEHIIY